MTEQRDIWIDFYSEFMKCSKDYLPNAFRNGKVFGQVNVDSYKTYNSH